MLRMVTVLFMFLMTFVMTSTTFVSAATDEVISCPGGSTDAVESVAMNILGICSTHLNTSVTRLEEGARILSLDGAFFHHDMALDILHDMQFWVTYCRDWPQFESCALDELRNCTSSEVDLLRKEVKTHVLRAWRSIGLFPVPVIEKWACNGPELSDRLRNVYAYEKSKGCDVDVVKKCLIDWHQDLQQSGFLETMDGSLLNKTDWLIRRVQFTLNCSRVSLKPCSSQKVVEFVDFVIKQSIPLEISKQMTEFDDAGKNEKTRNGAHNGRGTSPSSSSLLQTPKAVYAEVWFLTCCVQIVLQVLRGTVANSNTYDVS